MSASLAFTMSNLQLLGCNLQAPSLGIGRSNIGYPLDVLGDVNFTGILRSNGAAYVGSQWTTASVSNVYYSNVNAGNVGIGKSNPAFTLDVAGGINLTGAITTNGNAYAPSAIASGLLANRPTGTAGTMYYATDTALLYFYSSVWNTLTLTPATPLSVNILLIAGGGGGGGGGNYGGGGGGGAGELYYGTASLTYGSSLTISIGAGGQGAASYVNSSGSSGGNSSISGSLSLTIAGGGGGSSAYNSSGPNAGSGGSGGGGVRYGISGSSTKTIGYGNAGGAVSDPNGYGSASGGGGAGSAGGARSDSAAGNGGTGYTNSTIALMAAATSTGASGYYCGGGGGGAGGNGPTLGIGQNGGGSGGVGSTNATNATSHGSGGGGGNQGTGTTSSSGYQGLCIIMYSGTSSSTGGIKTVTGGYTYHCFTVIGSNTFTISA